MKYHFRKHRNKNGYWAECIELEGCQSQGNSMRDLVSSSHEALNLYLSESPESQLVFRNPQNHSGKDIFSVEVDPGVALALLIRQTRLKRKMTQTQMKDALGIKNLSNYQRLEDPKRANPELKTMIAIIKAFPEIKFGNLLESYRPTKKSSG